MKKIVMRSEEEKMTEIIDKNFSYLCVNVIGESETQRDRREKHFNADEKVLVSRRHGTGPHLAVVHRCESTNHSCPLQNGQHHS